MLLPCKIYTAIMHVTAHTKSLETFTLLVMTRMVDQEGVTFCDSASLCKTTPRMLVFSQAPTTGSTQCLLGLFPQRQNSLCEKLNTHFHQETKLRTDGAIPPYTVALYQARENETHSMMLTCDGNASVAKTQHRLDNIHFPRNKYARLYLLPTNCTS